MDLGKTFLVCGVATQEDRNGNEWVTDFKLFYSSDGNVWTPYKDADGVEVVRYACLSYDEDDHCVTNIIFKIKKTSHVSLQFLSFDWFTGHGICAHKPWTTNRVGTCTRQQEHQGKYCNSLGVFSKAIIPLTLS